MYEWLYLAIPIDGFDHFSLQCGTIFYRFIEVTNLENGKKFTFPVERWLAVNKEDGKVGCLLPVASREELSEFKYMFEAAAKFNLRNAHSWLSFMRRPPPSTFNRCQRLSVAVAILLCSMTASAMFYGASPSEPAEENKIGFLKFRWSQVCSTTPFCSLEILLICSIHW